MNILDNTQQKLEKPLDQGRVLKVLTDEAPALRQKAAPYVGDVKTDHTFRQFCIDLATTTLANRAWGIAAPQVGSPIRVICVMDDRGQPQVMVNPSITEKDSLQLRDKEGCLSFPFLFMNLWRPSSVVVNFMTPDGEYLTIQAEGMFARAVCHEVDHLNGVLFTDLVSSFEYQSGRRKAEVLKRKLSHMKKGK